MRIKEEILINIFEESFKDKVQRIYDESSLTSFVGRKYHIDYNFLEGYISIHGVSKKIGVVYMIEGDIFLESVFSDHIYYVGLFEHKLKKFIKSNQKRSRRKFTAR